MYSLELLLFCFYILVKLSCKSVWKEIDPFLSFAFRYFCYFFHSFFHFFILLCSNYHFFFFFSGYDRPNLFFEVKEKSKKATDTMPAMLAYVRTHDLNATGIVYCFSKKDCEKAADYLMANNVRTYFENILEQLEKIIKMFKRYLRKILK